MPYKNAEKRKEYLREYKIRNHNRLLELRKEQYRNNHPPKKNNAWSVGHSDFRYCRSCGVRAENKPPDTCKEPRHMKRFVARSKRNNEYRIEMRRKARDRGEIYRKGRGNLEHKAQYQKGVVSKLRDEIMDRLGQHTCVKCGFSDKRALQFDHVFGGGRRHRGALGTGVKYLKSLLTLPDEALKMNFQVLCANCNVIKREENGEYYTPKNSEKKN